jgi:4-amino-4-deoxy-L-arabinose transferase-like glycosyltransferase
MRITASDAPVLEDARRGLLHIPRGKILEWAGVSAVLLLAGWLLFANLASIGNSNEYYTAAVKAMLQSWHNFFFVAAEPGGSVSVDKPPLGLWLETISAYFLGVNGFAVVLPQILAGLGSIVVLYHLVRRKVGVAAGLLAGLALAVTPVVVATERNNTMDSTLIFSLLLAAWAFIKATETRNLRFLLLGAALVGVGFNIKMMQAYLPLPAFYALYFLGSSEKLWLKVRNLALATVLLAVVSFAWPVAVDLTPASQRPYVGSSGNNSELSLIFGYNGVNRLVGMNSGRSAFSGGGVRTGDLQPPSAGSPGQPPSGMGAPGGGQPPSATNNGFPNPGSNGFQPPMTGQDGGFNPQRGFTGGGAPGGGPGGFNTGQPGPLRLFTAPLSNEMSWLLPFGILSALLVAFRSRLRWPLAPEHQALVLWGGWLLTAAVFFSVAGFFHEYYLSMLAAPLAALVGLGAIGLWQLRKDRPWLAFGLLLAGAALTLAFQAITAHSFTVSAWWLPYTAGLMTLGALALILGTLRKRTFSQAAGFACVVAVLLVTPGAWSALTTLNTGSQGLPAAYSGGGAGSFRGGGGFGSGSGVDQALLAYLEQNTQGMRYMLAVSSAGEGEGYVLASGRGVLYMGGFNGQDQVVTSSDLANLVSAGELRFIQIGGRGGPGGGDTSLSSWVTSKCTLASAPGGSGTIQSSLYDCASAG